MSSVTDPETIQSKRIKYLKEKSLINIEDVKDAFLQSFCNFVSPLMQYAVGPDHRN
jgi:hypothetical protein